MTRAFNEEERLKLKQLIKESVAVTSEIETLQGGLNDTVKAIADEMQIKPAVLKKAVKMAYNRQFDKMREDIDIIESILNATGNMPTSDE